MPRRTDIQKILLIGSGPIVIGQGAEFDYSGTQAAKALREEGYTVVLVNSNPATIMTDPEFADRTYVEPVTPDVVAQVIERERPDALLPTMGGQTALNVALALADSGVLEKYGVELIGADARAIRLAEDRELFADAMRRIGQRVATGGIARTWDDAIALIPIVSFPAIIRPSFTLGGTGGGVAYNREEYEDIVRRGLDLSPTSQVLIERSLLGWKEYELEVMRDHADNVVIVCSIENIDPMGVHTGDSITVAPALTLTDREYQAMRDAAVAIIREIGVEAGGCNIQFAVNPADGELLVIEMNPRVSRSSALASKATGFPIARIGTKLAVGYSLDEITNDITKTTPASFEPVLDYVVVKCPRFAFEKFAAADPRLTTQMKSVGESMAIGRTFKEAFQKGLRALEIGRSGWHVGARLADDRLGDDTLETLRGALRQPTPERIFQVKYALERGLSIDEIYDLSKIDRWFLDQMNDLLEAERRYRSLGQITEQELRAMKRMGFSDAQLGALRDESEEQARERRWSLGVRPVYKMVDTCAGEFPSATPYLYGSYDEESEAPRSGKPSVVILGSGPNRIGQGVEFDYCCVRAVLALREAGYETIMVNSNPETVSTDFDISDKLYFEPLTLEDVLEIVQREQPLGVIVQLGGQTPIKLTRALERAGVKILGTSPDAIDIAEDRRRFDKVARELGIRQPPNGTATTLAEAEAVARDVGYPVLVRPSYVLGGRAMQIVYDEPSLRGYFETAARVSEDRPVLIDRFLEDAYEVDVDAIGDGTSYVIGGVMQHIEDAGIHSGDSACVLPPYIIREEDLATMRAHTLALAKALGVIGLINVQFAIRDRIVYVLEVNPRASRTIPFISKAIGVPLASLAARLMLGEKLADTGFTTEIQPPYVSVKEAVFPFNKFRGADPVLGPEMRSTGEVMGISENFGTAFAKAQLAADNGLPLSGAVLVTVNDSDKAHVAPIVRRFQAMGFQILATPGTAKFLRARGIAAEQVFKVHEGRPNGVDLIVNGQVQLLINTPLGKHSQTDDYTMRQAAVAHRIPYTTTMSAANAACDAILSLRFGSPQVRSLQEWHEVARAATASASHELPRTHRILMSVPLLDLKAQHARIREKVTAAMMQVVEDQTFILGKPVEEFEKACAALSHTKHAIGCANGSDALLLSLRAMDIGAGDEVITTPFTFFATAGMTHNSGARPVFADIDADTFSMNPEAAAAAVTSRTKAVMPVDLFGQMSPIERYRLAMRTMPIIEDAAQSIGARRSLDGEWTMAGEMANVGTFSFFPSKNLGGYGDGGMIVTSDDHLAMRLRRLRTHGAIKTYVHEEVGFNSRLDTLQAAVLMAKLPFLAEWSAARRKHAQYYDEAFRDVPEIRSPAIDSANESIYNQYTIRSDRRDALQAHLKSKEIGTAIYYPIPLHLQQCFAYLGYKQGAFPESERASKEVLSLPVYPELSQSQQNEVIEAVRSFFGR